MSGHLRSAATPNMTVVTRFAPSPTGFLHLGHAFSALHAWEAAKRQGGRFLLRIDDLDRGRARPEFEQAIYDDLRWLGLSWEPPVRRQSEHMADYRAALDRLEALGLVYPCFCTRKEIQAEIAAAGDAPHGPDGPLYPGTCRHLDAETRAAKLASGAAHALRLDTAKASQQAGPLSWTDLTLGPVPAEPERLGDVVLARKDTPSSYHLAVVVDDDAQGATRITRGADLLHASHLHRLLQALLGLPLPQWDHHRLITDASGKRLAKRHDSLTLRALRSAGESPCGIRQRLGLRG